MLTSNRILTYPFHLEMSEMKEVLDPHQGTGHRIHVERRILPLDRATHFEVTILDESSLKPGSHTP